MVDASSSLNPFATRHDSVQTSAEGQINWDAMANVTSLHESLSGTLESSSHVVSTQETNPFGDFTQSLNTNPFADDLNPFMSNTSASQASCDVKQSASPLEDQNFDVQNFDPFSTSKSDEPLVQSFASDFDPFTPQATMKPLDQSRENLELLDVFGSDIKGDVLDSSISELSDSVFVSTSTNSLLGLKQSSDKGLESTADVLDMSKEKIDQESEKDSSYKSGKGFGNRLYGNGSLEDSGSVGFGSPFGTTTFGSEFGDLEHVRQYAKLMEERDNGSDDDACSVEFSDDNDKVDFSEAISPAPGKTLISNVELHTPGSTKGSEEIQIEDHTSDTQVVGEATSSTRSSQDMDGLMKTFDQLKLSLGSLARTESVELLDAEEPPQSEGPLMKSETFNIPPEEDLGDSDFMASDSARTSSSYSYTSNPMSSRQFQEAFDMRETGESHLSFDEGESSHTLHSQLSNADRNFSEAFHETQERKDSDQSGAVAEVSALEARHDSELLFDAESGEIVRSSIDEDMSCLSSMETLPIRGPASTKTYKDDLGDESQDITDDDVEYVETPRSEEYDDRSFEDKKQHVHSISNALKNKGDEVVEVSDDDMEYVVTPRSLESDNKSVEEGKQDLQRKGNWSRGEGNEVTEVADECGKYIETSQYHGDSYKLVEVEEKQQTVEERLKTHKDDANDEAIEVTDDDDEYVETPRSQDDTGKQNVQEQEVSSMSENDGITNDGVLFQSTASHEEMDSEMPEIKLDVENEATTSSSVSHSSEKGRRISDESIPEVIDIESSEETVEDNNGEETVTISRSSITDANNEGTDRDVSLTLGKTNTMEIDETQTADGREEDAYRYPDVGGDEAMTISGDEMEYVETPRSPKSEVKHNSDGSDTDSSCTQDTVLKVPSQSIDAGNAVNTHARLTRQTSVLGDEDVGGMSDSMVNYVPSPRVSDLSEELGESEGKRSATEENSIVRSSDMDVSIEDVESLDSEIELKPSQDFDRRTSNAGFEVDKDTNDGVLFEGSKSDETVEPKETEEILELENEATESSSAVSSPTKEKKTVTFGNTYELRQVGEEVIEVALGDSVEFVKSSSED